MTMLYPIVLKTEENGTVSAYVPGLPVYAAADSDAKAKRAIRAVLAEYLKAHPASRPDAQDRAWGANDGTRSDDAPDLFRRGEIPGEDSRCAG